MSAASIRSRLGALRRRVLGTGTAPEVQARLDHQDRALHDITAALQQVQAVVPPPGTDRAEALVELQRRVDALELHLPELLGLWSSTGGTQRRLQRQLDERAESLAQHATSIEELWQRIEFVRREVLYELRYSDAERAAAPASDGPEVRVVDADRVAAVTAEGGLRLNLGCGHLPMADYVNVDIRELPGVDVVAPIDQLPFDDGTVTEIHSAHVLEHFPQEDLQRRLLPYWRDKLEPGGVFRGDGARWRLHARRPRPRRDLLRGPAGGPLRRPGVRGRLPLHDVRCRDAVGAAGRRRVHRHRGRGRGPPQRHLPRAAGRGPPARVSPMSADTSSGSGAAVSVVINTLDRADALELLLDALTRITYRDFEVVVVVGPCTDHTDEVLDRWAGSVKVLRCPEPNLSMSRNIGIAAAAADTWPSSTTTPCPSRPGSTS